MGIWRRRRPLGRRATCSHCVLCESCRSAVIAVAVLDCVCCDAPPVRVLVRSGAGQEVGRSCIMLEFKNKKIMVGMVVDVAVGDQ